MKLIELRNVIQTDLMIYDESTGKVHKDVCVFGNVFESLSNKIVTKITTGTHSVEKNLSKHLINGLLICVKNA